MDYIDSVKESHGVEPVCAVLAEAGVLIAPSTYYARRVCRISDAELEQAYLASRLRSIWEVNWAV